MNEWHRIDGPVKIHLDESNAGDDARGNYAWSSLYGCGLARAEVTHVLVANDMMEEWGNDGDGSRVHILEGTHLYVVTEDGEHDDYAYEEYEYETPGLHDYELSDALRAYADLDRMATPDMSWALCGPDEKADEVYTRKPLLREWDAAMKFEIPLDKPARMG